MEHIVVIKKNLENLSFVITLIGRYLLSVKMNYQPNHSTYFNNFYVIRFCKSLVYNTIFIAIRETIFIVWEKIH